MLWTILLVILILMLLGALPRWATAEAGVMDPAAGWDWLC